VLMFKWENGMGHNELVTYQDVARRDGAQHQRVCADGVCEQIKKDSKKTKSGKKGKKGKKGKRGLVRASL
jgi:hypothetical protein